MFRNVRTRREHPVLDVVLPERVDKQHMLRRCCSFACRSFCHDEALREAGLPVAEKM